VNLECRLHEETVSESEHTMTSWPRLALLVSVAISAGCAAATAIPEESSRSLVTAEDLERYPGEPIERVIERKVPGVVVIRTTDGGFALRIRGASSYDGSGSAPLYVLNGLPIQTGREGAVPDLNPYDIESIKVLRGGDAAIYGIDGANGVILITTKKAGTNRDLQ
jgi:TonB-dependent SusC/RagA subfamily outer membrane receptor